MRKFSYPVLCFLLSTLILYSCEKNKNAAPSENAESDIVFNPDLTYGQLTDIEGNIYKTIVIGDQEWMAENLRSTTYSDGTPIPNETDGEVWVSLITGAYCNYNNTSDSDTIETYGRLYNWYAVTSGKLAPDGWHVPTDEEWKQLEIYLGMSQSEADEGYDRGTDEGGKLKETGLNHWAMYNIGANNETGFTALPGGYRNYVGDFEYITGTGAWWTATDGGGSTAIDRGLYHDGKRIGRYRAYCEEGLSVRCVKD